MLLFLSNFYILFIIFMSLYYCIVIIAIFMFYLDKTFARNIRRTVSKLVTFRKAGNKIVQKDC